MTRDQIIERVVPRTSGGKQHRRRAPKKTLTQIREGFTNGANGHAANGHAALIGIPSYVESQTLKEFHLAELRGIEVQSKRRDLLPIEPLLSICFSGLRFMKQRLAALPPELGVDFGRTLEKALSQRLEHIFAEARRVNEQECAKRGIHLPPEPPPAPMPPQLPYYQQYERGSTTGAVENTMAREQIGTVEWMMLHPSIDLQASFKISATKKQWDERMAELLNSRHAWDLAARKPQLLKPLEPQDDAA